MAATDEETRTICVLGVAGKESAVEIYGVNAAREVTIHGWFQLSECFLVLANRPRCLIAIDADTLPSEFIREMLRLGHSVIVMPVAPSIASSRPYRRTAREICNLIVSTQAELFDHQTLQ